MNKQGEIFEEYTNTKYLKILTQEQLHIPGMFLFGRQIRTSATESLPSHNHGNCYEFVFLCSGSPCFSVQGKQYTLSGGDVFITRPWEQHSTNANPVSISEMYWFQLDLSSPDGALFLTKEALLTLDKKLRDLPTQIVSMDLGKTKELLKNAFRAAASGTNPQLAAQYLALFLYLLLEASERVEFRLTPDIGRSVTYILDHLNSQIDLAELAQISYLSVSQFKQKFKQQIGISPRQFINMQKIRFAKELLQEGNTVSQVAAALQFESTSYFIAVFKKYTSCTPGEYQKDHSPIDTTI